MRKERRPRATSGSAPAFVRFGEKLAVVLGVHRSGQPEGNASVEEREADRRQRKLARLEGSLRKA